MTEVSWPLFKKRFRIIFLICILLFACESDPVIFNPVGGYEYLNKSFSLDKSFSRSYQGNNYTGLSERLYSGYLPEQDSAQVYINLFPEILDTHNICSSNEIKNFSIILNTVSPILLKYDSTHFDTLIDFSALKVHMILSDLVSEDQILSFEAINQQIAETDAKIISSVNLFESSVEIDLLSSDSNIVNQWCEQNTQIGLILKYTPNDSSYIEFYSSDISQISFAPQLFINYSHYDESNKIYNRYSVDEVSWSSIINLDNGPYFINDTNSIDWGTFYLMDLNNNDKIIDSPLEDYSPAISDFNLINSGETLDLVTIKLSLNSQIIDDLDSIEFFIDNAFGYISEDDPSKDNYDIEFRPDSSENNLLYDLGELFNDFGLDNCPDSLETGLEDNKCSSALSTYNLGTEGNNIRDWIDYNGNNQWDNGEGEEWGDWGNDWCPDSLEGGNGICLNSPPELSLGYDPNQDNIDPSGDDWDGINNLNGTEKNNVWDIGEHWFDWGLDGLPISVLGYADSTEGNGIYDFGEKFTDTGIDGLFNKDEAGFNEYRTEGNNQFDGSGEFNDFGLDNICQNCEGDTDDDDYNIDPNNDNWFDCNSDQTICQNDSNWDTDYGNEKWDLNEGTENNGILDLGEEWFDWGFDGIHDSLEAFQSSLIIPIMVSQSNYIYNLDSGNDLSFPQNSDDDTVMVWISKISRNDNFITIEIKGKSNLNLKGLEFQLIHTPYSKIDTFLVDNKYYIQDINDSKIFEDLTLIPKKQYSDELLLENLFTEYSNDVYATFDFDSLNEFIYSENFIFSHEYSNLVFYIDKTKSHIDDNGMQILIIHTSENNSDQLLASKMIFGESDSVQINIGQHLRAFQADTLDTYNGFKIMYGSSNLYNYSKLYFLDNARLDIMYTK